MMQDKNKLDDMTKKYKEEMMRLYKSKPKPPASAPQQAQAVQTPASGTAAEVKSQPEAKLLPAQTSPVSVQSEAKEVCKDDTAHAAAEQKSQSVSTPKTGTNVRNLSKPPMPKIPFNYQNRQNPQSTQSPSSAETAAVTSSKFPTAEEILKSETAAAGTSLKPSDTHNQGNYNAAGQPTSRLDNTNASAGDERINESYPNENTDFSSVDTGENFASENPPDMSGQGYLQIEVTTASGAVPVRDATVIITEQTDGLDSLIGMVITDENGTTPIVPLSAPPQSFSESPDPSERPYSEYNISVYKKGFYSIPKLTVPVFDTIKSIQPVSVIPLAEFERNGSEVPNENR
ncbi:MAG: hypothetical protein K2K34_06980 [Oscillospiraceae bacterium]|nr:hypothetical protein [Oscillospiraceae bacterium]